MAGQAAERAFEPLRADIARELRGQTGPDPVSQIEAEAEIAPFPRPEAQAVESSLALRGQAHHTSEGAAEVPAFGEEAFPRETDGARGHLPNASGHEHDAGNDDGSRGDS